MKNTFIIKKGSTIKYILKKGKYKAGKNIVVHFTKISKKNNIINNYFCVCVSKKNGNSVQRNKLKRWAREAYKNLEIYTKKGYNIITIYKKNTSIDNSKYIDIYNDILKCFKELGIYNNEK